MSKANKDGGPAFPQGVIERDWRIVDGVREDEPAATSIGFNTVGGMSLRDYFAAQAMQVEYSGRLRASFGLDFETIAKESYRLADALIAARK